MRRLTIFLFTLVLLVPASAQARFHHVHPTRAMNQAVHDYLVATYSEDDNPVYLDARAYAGDARRAVYQVRLIGNPAPGLGKCLTAVERYVGDCPDPIYDTHDDFPVWLIIDLYVTRCKGGGYGFLVGWLGDQQPCPDPPARLPRW
jgi:hypothetical protein